MIAAMQFAALIAEFIVRCGVEPFHLVAIGANGAVSVSHHRHGGDGVFASNAPACRGLF